MVAIRVATLLLCAGAPAATASFFRPNLKAALNLRRLQVSGGLCDAAGACANESPDDTGITETCFAATNQYAGDFAECGSCDPPVTSSATVCPACEQAVGAALSSCSTTVEPSGEDVCEGHNFDEPTCLQKGCCQWDGDCHSNVGANPCSQTGGGPPGETDPCPTEGMACMSAPACASIMTAGGQDGPDMAACAANAECAALLRCYMDAHPSPPEVSKCQATYDTCAADSACLGAMMTMTNPVTDYRTCVANKLCRQLYLCMEVPCNPARSPGCTLKRILLNEPSGLDNAHKFIAKAMLDAEDPLAARLFP